MDNISDKITMAVEKYGHFNSTHEVYGVLLEEVDEFFQEVKRPNHPDQNERKSQRMIEELEDIAAICLRARVELIKGQIKWV